MRSSQAEVCLGAPTQSRLGCPMAQPLRQQASCAPLSPGFLRIGRSSPGSCAHQQLSGNVVDAGLILFTILLPA